MALEATAQLSSTDLDGLPRLLGEYRRRRPEKTPLYEVIQENYQTFVHLREEEGRPLPAFVRREFEKFLTWVQLSEGFLRLHAAHARLRRLVVPTGELEKKSCPCAKESPVRRDGRLAWAELLARVFQADVFQCSRCGAHGMQRIATILDHDVIRRILRAVGLPTDPPTSHPRRSSELFVD